MTNKEKAQKLAEEHENATLFGIESPYHAALGAAIDMAEWKDKQYAEKIEEIKSNIIAARDDKEYYESRGECVLDWVLRLIDAIMKGGEK